MENNGYPPALPLETVRGKLTVIDGMATLSWKDKKILLEDLLEATPFTSSETETKSEAETNWGYLEAVIREDVRGVKISEVLVRIGTRWYTLVTVGRLPTGQYAVLMRTQIRVPSMASSREGGISHEALSKAFRFRCQEGAEGGYFEIKELKGQMYLYFRYREQTANGKKVLRSRYLEKM